VQGVRTASHADSAALVAPHGRSSGGIGGPVACDAHGVIHSVSGEDTIRAAKTAQRQPIAIAIDRPLRQVQCPAAAVRGAQRPGIRCGLRPGLGRS
jgi:hypothetical protein